MKTYLDCIPCFLGQALRAARAATDNKSLHLRVLYAVIKMLPKLSINASPPEFGQKIYSLVSQITGNNDPFYEIKGKANQLALDLYPRLKQMVADSEDPLLTACKLAIAGNSIDLAPQFKYPDLDSILETALTLPFSINSYEGFRKSIMASSRILYLGDNAGEVVFDRVLIEEIHKIKELEIYFAVRGKPVINDVTKDDVEFIGLDKVANIVSNGSDAPATILSQCSPEMLELYQSADLIISKGQGNYESLSGEKTNIFFLLRAKCRVVARSLGVKAGDAVLKGAIN